MKFVLCVLLASLTKTVYGVNESEAAQYQPLEYELLHTRIDNLQEILKSYLIESYKNTEIKIEELIAKMETSKTNNSRLVERIIELEALATTLLSNQTSIEGKTSDIGTNLTLVETDSRDETSNSLQNQAKQPPCLNTSTPAFTSKKVVCEMEAFDGGWIVIQQRTDHKLDFNRSWAEYRDGFGTVESESEFWLGLELTHLLTAIGANCELAVEMKNISGEYKYARYSQFELAGEADRYRLKVAGYSGTAGDKLSEVHNNRPFSTYDSDYAFGGGGHCARAFGSGWWYNNCFMSNLNYPAAGVWYGSPFGEYKLTYSRMMVRCQ